MEIFLDTANIDEISEILEWKDVTLKSNPKKY